MPGAGALYFRLPYAHSARGAARPWKQPPGGAATAANDTEIDPGWIGPGFTTHPDDQLSVRPDLDHASSGRRPPPLVANRVSSNRSSTHPRPMPTMARGLRGSKAAVSAFGRRRSLRTTRIAGRSYALWRIHRAAGHDARGHASEHSNCRDCCIRINMPDDEIARLAFNPKKRGLVATAEGLPHWAPMINHLRATRRRERPFWFLAIPGLSQSYPPRPGRDSTCETVSSNKK